MKSNTKTATATQAVTESSVEQSPVIQTAIGKVQTEKTRSIIIEHPEFRIRSYYDGRIQLVAKTDQMKETMMQSEEELKDIRSKFEVWDEPESAFDFDRELDPAQLRKMDLKEAVQLLNKAKTALKEQKKSKKLWKSYTVKYFEIETRGVSDVNELTMRFMSYLLDKC